MVRRRIWAPWEKLSSYWPRLPFSQQKPDLKQLEQRELFWYTDLTNWSDCRPTRRSGIKPDFRNICGDGPEAIRTLSPLLLLLLWSASFFLPADRPPPPGRKHGCSELRPHSSPLPSTERPLFSPPVPVKKLGEGLPLAQLGGDAYLCGQGARYHDEPGVSQLPANRGQGWGRVGVRRLRVGPHWEREERAISRTRGNVHVCSCWDRRVVLLCSNFLMTIATQLHALSGCFQG